jgi:Bacteriophage lambda tail assembly protein I.
MKIIKLLGDLQAFREEWELDVRTPGEALRAIEANRPGFLSACDAGDYAVILVDQINPDFSRQITLVEAELPWADELLVVVPRAGGDIPAAF